jgi:phage/plasmid primase-like uncharacterized protein
LTEKSTHPPANKEQSVSENEQKGRGAKKCFCLGEGKEINVGARGGMEGGREAARRVKQDGTHGYSIYFKLIFI